MVLKINESSDNIISEWMKTEMSEYIKFIAKKLDCAIDELCYLDVHPDFKDLDEEGWNIDSFFPKGTKFAVATLHDDMNGKIAIEIPNFSIGVVKEVVVNGKVFYADYNASPVGIITKREGLW
jgi:hypothetical protein